MRTPTALVGGLAGVKEKEIQIGAHHTARPALLQAAAPSVHRCRIETNGATFSFANCDTGIDAGVADIFDENLLCLVDRVAWPVREPGRWDPEKSVAIIAGEDALKRAEWYSSPVVVYETPLEWRRQRDSGNLLAICVLDANSDFESMLEGFDVRATGKVKAKLDRIQQAKRLRRPLPLHIERVAEDDVPHLLAAFRSVVCHAG